MKQIEKKEINDEGKMIFQKRSNRFFLYVENLQTVKLIQLW